MAAEGSDIFFSSGTDLPETAALISKAAGDIATALERINKTKVSPNVETSTGSLSKLLEDVRGIGNELGAAYQKIENDSKKALSTPGFTAAPNSERAKSQLASAQAAAEKKIVDAVVRSVSSSTDTLKAGGNLSSLMGQVTRAFDDVFTAKAKETLSAIRKAAQSSGISPTQITGIGKNPVLASNTGFSTSTAAPLRELDQLRAVLGDLRITVSQLAAGSKLPASALATLKAGYAGQGPAAGQVGFVGGKYLLNGPTGPTGVTVKGNPVSSDAAVAAMAKITDTLGNQGKVLATESFKQQASQQQLSNIMASQVKVQQQLLNVATQDLANAQAAAPAKAAAKKAPGKQAAKKAPLPEPEPGAIHAVLMSDEPKKAAKKAAKKAPAKVTPNALPPGAYGYESWSGVEADVVATPEPAKMVPAKKAAKKAPAKKAAPAKLPTWERLVDMPDDEFEAYMIASGQAPLGSGPTPVVQPTKRPAKKAAQSPPSEFESDFYQDTGIGIPNPATTPVYGSPKVQRTGSAVGLDEAAGLYTVGQPLTYGQVDKLQEKYQNYGSLPESESDPNSLNALIAHYKAVLVPGSGKYQELNAKPYDQLSDLDVLYKQITEGNTYQSAIADYHTAAAAPGFDHASHNKQVQDFLKSYIDKSQLPVAPLDLPAEAFENYLGPKNMTYDQHAAMRDAKDEELKKLQKMHERGVITDDELTHERAGVYAKTATSHSPRFKSITDILDGQGINAAFAAGNVSADDLAYRNIALQNTGHYEQMLKEQSTLSDEPLIASLQMKKSLTPAQDSILHNYYLDEAGVHQPDQLNALLKKKQQGHPLTPGEKSTMSSLEVDSHHWDPSQYEILGGDEDAYDDMSDPDAPYIGKRGRPNTVSPRDFLEQAKANGTGAYRYNGVDLYGDPVKHGGNPDSPFWYIDEDGHPGHRAGFGSRSDIDVPQPFPLAGEYRRQGPAFIKPKGLADYDVTNTPRLDELQSYKELLAELARRLNTGEHTDFADITDQKRALGRTAAESNVLQWGMIEHSSGRGGKRSYYTKDDERQGRIPAGRKVGDMRHGPLPAFVGLAYDAAEVGAPVNTFPSPDPNTLYRGVAAGSSMVNAQVGQIIDSRSPKGHSKDPTAAQGFMEHDSVFVKLQNPVGLDIARYNYQFPHEQEVLAGKRLEVMDKSVDTRESFTDPESGMNILNPMFGKMVVTVRQLDDEMGAYVQQMKRVGDAFGKLPYEVQQLDEVIVGWTHNAPPGMWQTTPPDVVRNERSTGLHPLGIFEEVPADVERKENFAALEPESDKASRTKAFNQAITDLAIEADQSVANYRELSLFSKESAELGSTAAEKEANLSAQLDALDRYAGQQAAAFQLAATNAEHYADEQSALNQLSLHDAELNNSNTEGKYNQFQVAMQGLVSAAERQERAFGENFTPTMGATGPTPYFLNNGGAYSAMPTMPPPPPSETPSQVSGRGAGSAGGSDVDTAALEVLAELAGTMTQKSDGNEAAKQLAETALEEGKARKEREEQQKQAQAQSAPAAAAGGAGAIPPNKPPAPPGTPPPFGPPPPGPNNPPPGAAPNYGYNYIRNPQSAEIAAHDERARREALAATNRYHVARAQVQAGQAYQAGQYIFQPNGQVVDSLGRLVTDYKQLASATNELTTAIRRQVDVSHMQAEEHGKTPLNQFYKGFFGAGGRKRHGGAQDVDEENPLNGLFETAGVVAKYEILGRGMQSLAGYAFSAIKDFGELDQATRELNEQLGEGQHASDAYISSLENIASASGGDLVDAMEAARRGIAAFSSETDSASQRREVGRATAQSAATNAVITGQDIKGSTTDLIAIGGAYDIGKTAGGLDAVSNAVASAKESFGSDSNEVQKGLSLLGETGKNAGFSLNELASVIGLVQARTGESGTAIAGTFTRIFATLQNGQTSADLAKSLGIDLTGSPAEKIQQLAAAFPKLTQAEKYQLEQTVGGSKAMREFVTLLQNQEGYQKAAAKATEDSGAGARQYQAIIGSISGQIKVFSATVRQLALDIARSGVLTPLIAGFKLLEPAIKVIDGIVQAWDALPGALKESVSLLLEAVVAMNAIKAASLAGVGTTGVGRLLAGGKQLGGTLLGNPFRTMVDPHAELKAAQDESLRATAAVEAEKSAQFSRMGSVAAAAAAGTVPQSAVAAEEAAGARRLAEAHTAAAAAAIKLTEVDEAARARTSKAAESETVATGAQTRATESATISVAEFGAMLKRVGETELTMGGARRSVSGAASRVRGFIGSPAVEEDLAAGVAGREATGMYAEGGALARGGRLSKLGFGAEKMTISELPLAGLVGPVVAVTAGFAALTYELVKNVHAQERASAASEKAVDAAEKAATGGTTDDLRTHATALLAAGKQVADSRNSFTGRFNRLVGNAQTGQHEAASDTNLGNFLNTQAAALDNAAAKSTTAAGAYDLTSPTGIQTGYDLLINKGYTAQQAMDALSKAIDHVTSSTNGAAGGLSDFVSQNLPTYLGINDASIRTDRLKYFAEGDYASSHDTGPDSQMGMQDGLPTLSKNDLQTLQASQIQKTLNTKQDGKDQNNAELIAAEQLKLDAKSQADVGGFGPGQTPNKQQLAEFQKQREANYVQAYKDITGRDLSQLKKDYPELYKALVSDPIKGSDVKNINGAAAQQTKAELAATRAQQISALAPQAAAKVGTDAATNVALGLNPDGTDPAAKPPTQNGTDASSTFGRKGLQDDKSFRFQLNKYEHDKNRVAEVQNDGVAVSSDKAEIGELQQQIDNIKKVDPGNKTALQPLQQHMRELQVKLQNDIQSNLQSLGALAVASLGEFDKSGVIQTQISYIDKELKSTKNVDTKRQLLTQRLQLVQQQADQALADQANILLSTVAPADATGTAAANLQVGQAKLNQMLSDKHASKGDIAGQQNVVASLTLAAATANNNDLTTAANNQLAIGDSLGEQRNAAQAFFNRANNRTLDPTKIMQEADRRAGRAAQADYRIASNQAYGALALSKIDPRDPLANDARQKVITDNALARVKPGDLVGQAAAQAAVRDLALKTVQDRLDAANSRRIGATDPQDTVATAKNALLDAEGRLAAANKNEADYGQLKQAVLQRQQDFANAVNEQAKATKIAKIDPRDAVALDQANLDSINGQLKSFKGKHTDKGYLDLLAQQKQAQIDLVRDRDAKANAMAESTIDSRDLSGEAAEKVREAKVKLDHDDKNSAEYGLDLKAYQDSLLAQANTARAIADAAEEASVAPGDAIGEARAQMDAATRALAADIPGQAQFFDDQKKFREAEFALARAQEDYATTLEALGTDQTNPVVQAQNALDAARRKYADDAKLGADPATLAADQLAVSNDQNAVQKSLFEQQLQDAQTNFSLHRMSGAAYIQYLRATQANLKATGLGTRQLLDEYNEVSQQLLSANQQLQGQFNLGQIKLPTVYQERRQALQNGIDISAAPDQTGGNSFGSATDPLQIAVQDRMSPLVSAIKQINTQSAVDQLAALQSALNALGGGATPASSAPALAGSNLSSVVTNNTTINGADFAKVVAYMASVLGSQAIGTRSLTSARKV